MEFPFLEFLHDLGDLLLSLRFLMHSLARLLLLKPLKPLAHAELLRLGLPSEPVGSR